jgi:hypothetical protein
LIYLDFTPHPLPAFFHYKKNTMDTIIATPQPVYLISEEIHNKGGIPNLVNTVGPQLKQVMRRVYQVHAHQDVFYEGKKIKGAPTAWQVINEYVRPGQQITTINNGQKSLVLVYAGYSNVVQPIQEIGKIFPKTVTNERNIGTGLSLFNYGVDPLPNTQLYKNSKISFTMPGGEGVPTAIAVFDGKTGNLEPLAQTNLKEAIARLTGK